MNVINILWKLGYDIHSFKDGIYEVSFSPERRRRLRKSIAEGSVFDGDVCDHWYFVVDEISFNGLGDLFVAFNIEGTKDCFDVYEHNNMSADDLY